MQTFAKFKYTNFFHTPLHGWKVFPSSWGQLQTDNHGLLTYSSEFLLNYHGKHCYYGMNQILILSVVYILLSCLYFWKCLLVVTTEIVPQFDFDPVPSNKNFKWCWQVLLTTISWDSCKLDQTPSNNERLFVYYSTSVALLGACLLSKQDKTTFNVLYDWNKPESN